MQTVIENCGTVYNTHSLHPNVGHFFMWSDTCTSIYCEWHIFITMFKAICLFGYTYTQNTFFHDRHCDMIARKWHLGNTLFLFLGESLMRSLMSRLCLSIVVVRRKRLGQLNEIKMPMKTCTCSKLSNNEKIQLVLFTLVFTFTINRWDIRGKLELYMSR